MDKKTRLLTVFACGAALAAGGATFYVDPAAAPGGDGSFVKPFATLAAARDGVRAARQASRISPAEAVEIVLAPGDYVQTESFALDDRDGGMSAELPVVWKAAQAGTARIVGGARVPAGAFKPVTDAAVLARLPEEARGKVLCADVSKILPGKIPPMALAFGGTPTAPMLFLNHRFGTLARWPNADYTSFSKCVDHGAKIKMTSGGGSVNQPGAFVYSDPRAKRWNFAEGVWMNGYWTHDWDNHSVKAASYGAENGTNDVIRLAATIPYGVMGRTWGRKERRFYVFNLLDELDAPGEWYLDRTRKVLYFCPPEGGLKAEDEVFVATFGEPIVSAKKIAHVRFEGIVFEYAYGTGVAIAGNDVQLVGCRVACCGGTGVSLHGDRNAMRNCEVAQVGRAGVSAGGGDRKTLRRAESVFEGNHVHDFGVFQRTYAPGFGVSGCGITLRANVMHDAPHSAVLYGGNEHLFEYNNVYRVLLETGDAGAYYTGRDWTTQGNLLRFNYTHDLGAEGEMANTMGFYFDDCDCGDEVYGNVFHNVSRGIMVGGGREHPIRNNVFSRCLIGMSIDCRGMTWKHWNSVSVGGSSWLLEDKAKAFGYTNGVWAARYPRLADIMNDHPREPLYNPVENNVFIDCRQQVLALGKEAPLERMAPIANNVVVNTRGTNGVRCASVDARIAGGFTVLNGSTNAPCAFGFADATNGDFRFLPGAEILKACPGFQLLPLERIAAEPGAGTSDSDRLEAAIKAACAPGGTRRVVIGANPARKDGNWLIDRAILLPDEFTLELDGAWVELAPGVRDNLIRNAGAVATGHVTPNRGIRVLGRNGATLCGGRGNHYAPNRSGDANGWRTVGILFAGVTDYELAGFTMRETQCWAISQENGCARGHVHDIVFADTNLNRNQDGIDVRKGCHDIVIENISGVTGDDTVALTGLRRPKDAPRRTTSRKLPIQIGGWWPTDDDDIHDITIRNVRARSAGGDGVIRLLTQDGIKMYNIVVSNVVDTTSGSQKRAQATIRIGDVNYWTIKRNELGEMHHVTVTDVDAKGRVGVWIKGPLADSAVTNIRVPEGTKKYDVSVPVERVKFD